MPTGATLLTHLISAARTAMAFLNAGASAVDAVEAAIKSLEDTEITNSGFGSNLSRDGVVECDATIVDHRGRSGACGAVSSEHAITCERGPFHMQLTWHAVIKNPISLAKLILEKSSQPLFRLHVPPNMLVASGAKNFASEHGIPLTRNELLVSRNARDRYERWTDELRRANIKPIPERLGSCQHNDEPKTPRVSAEAAVQANVGAPCAHVTAILTGIWNEGQPDSPGRTPKSRVPRTLALQCALPLERVPPVPEPLIEAARPASWIPFTRPSKWSRRSSVPYQSREAGFLPNALALA